MSNVNPSLILVDVKLVSSIITSEKTMLLLFSDMVILKFNNVFFLNYIPHPHVAQAM